MNKKYIFANWKMYLTIEQSLSCAEELSSIMFDRGLLEMAVFPNALAFCNVAKLLDTTSWNVGAQNVAWTPAGAYTGALSAVLYKEAGAHYALVGHSERRHVFGEKNIDVRKKIESCFDAGITPVLCIGETQEDRDNDKALYRIKKQLYAVFEDMEYGDKDIIIAYEPVWAIGTGNACSVSDACDMVHYIRQELAIFSREQTPILYGGSVDSKNVVLYLSQKSIDGVLVGSASTHADELQYMIEQFVN